jgi:hypothetical protein
MERHEPSSAKADEEVLLLKSWRLRRPRPWSGIRQVR